MQAITTIGLDIAKSVFQVHGVDAKGDVVLRRQIKRRYVLAFFQNLPPCLVGIEACASAHHWSRELQALGHTVRLMPPAYVTPYVKRHKNDAIDAEAICEAVTRPIAVRGDQDTRATELPDAASDPPLVRSVSRLSVINAIRAHLAEFGIDRAGWAQRRRPTARPSSPMEATSGYPSSPGRVSPLSAPNWATLKAQILQFDRLIMAWHRSSEASRRLDDIPGVGPALATALVATVADPRAFRSGRNFSAWIGLVPKQHSSGGKDRLGSISKRGDRYLRFLFVAGALAVIRYRQDPWRQAPALAHSIAGAAPHQDRRHRACQQDRPDGMGDRWPRASTIRNPSRLRHKRDRAGQPA